MEFKDFSKLDFWTKENQFNQYTDIKSHKQFGQYHADAELTIAIPVYNRTTFLREAIDSALQQDTDRVYDIIVVDNASEDDAVQQIVFSYPQDRIVYFRNDENIGMTGNWNRCYELAKTKWVTLLHDDDRLKPNYVETVLTVADKYGDSIGCLGTLHDDIDENGNILRGAVENTGAINEISTEDFYRQITPINIAGLMMDRYKVMDIGGFNEDFYPSQDANLMVKIGVSYGGINISNNLCDYRIAENESLKPKTMYDIMSYIYTHVCAMYKSEVIVLPLWLHKIHLNAVMTSTEDAVRIYWKMNLDFKQIRLHLRYRRMSLFYSVLHKIGMKILLNRKIKVW